MEDALRLAARAVGIEDTDNRDIGQILEAIQDQMSVQEALRGQLVELEQEHAEALEQLQQHARVYNDVSNASQDLQERLEAAQATYGTQLDALTADLEALQQQLDLKDEEIAELRKNIEQDAQALPNAVPAEEVAAQVKRLEEEVQMYMDTIQGLEREKADMAAQAGAEAESGATVAELLAENAALKRQVESLQAGKDRLQSDADVLQGEVLAGLAKIADLEALAEGLEGELSAAKEDSQARAELEFEVDSLRDQLEESQKDLECLKDLMREQGAKTAQRQAKEQLCDAFDMFIEAVRRSAEMRATENAEHPQGSAPTQGPNPASAVGTDSVPVHAQDAAPNKASYPQAGASPSTQDATFGRAGNASPADAHQASAREAPTGSPADVQGSSSAQVRGTRHAATLATAFDMFYEACARLKERRRRLHGSLARSLIAPAEYAFEAWLQGVGIQMAEADDDAYDELYELRDQVEAMQRQSQRVDEVDALLQIHPVAVAMGYRTRSPSKDAFAGESDSDVEVGCILVCGVDCCCVGVYDIRSGFEDIRT
jgi:hypothetical protein